jgi:hypothetical protein
MATSDAGIVNKLFSTIVANCADGIVHEVLILKTSSSLLWSIDVTDPATIGRIPEEVL